MPQISPMKYREVLDEHRRRLAAIVDQRGVRAMKKLYDDATAEIVRKLAAIAPNRQNSFEAHHNRMVLAQLKEGSAMLARRMYGELGDLTREAQVDAVRGLDKMITRLEQHHSGLTPVLPTADAARFAGIIDSKRTSLLREFPRGTQNRIERQGVKRVAERMNMQQRQANSVANLAVSIIGKCEKELALSTLQNEPAHATIDRIHGVIDGQWYESERIVRTEGAWAQNASARDTVDAVAERIPQMRSRWSEHVSDDGSYLPLDDRVAVDSLALHGQVADMGGLFTMPATAPRGTLKHPNKVDVPTALVGGQWDHPPDRPNDRSCVAPWRPEWGGVGWRYENGRRVPLN